MTHKTNLILERDPIKISPHCDEIRELADSETKSLGFLPKPAFKDAIEGRKLIAYIIEYPNDEHHIAGYVLFGGVYPHASIQQICVRKEWRRQDLASNLIRTVISDHEQVGFISIKAQVASDLKHAQEFYASHKFEQIREKNGGSSRNRTIIVRERILDTPSLFSPVQKKEYPFVLPKKFGHISHFYTFDINVFLDLIKNRSRHPDACALFGAALKQQIMLRITPEFITELERTSFEPTNDPILQMALRLPCLPPTENDAQLNILAESIYQTVFIERNAKGCNTPQAKSDSRHLAMSAIHHSAGFITSDRAILSARNELLSRFGIDVASLDELLSLIPDGIEDPLPNNKTGQGFSIATPNSEDIKTYLHKNDIPISISEEIRHLDPLKPNPIKAAIWEHGNIVAFSYLASSNTIEGESRLFIHVSNNTFNRELYIDYLLDTATKQACLTSPKIIRLLHIDGQSLLINEAQKRGFSSIPDGKDLYKIAIGQPITNSDWNPICNKISMTMGILLPTKFPHLMTPESKIKISNRFGETSEIIGEKFEDFFSPTLLLWPGRTGVIVPIQRQYADDLLGTNAQNKLPFMESRDVAFLSQRSYVCSIKNRALMKSGLPIIFYESSPKGGQKAAVAAGRIISTTIERTDNLSNQDTRRLAVEDPSIFSASKDILLTTFDNIIRFPSPVSLKELRKIEATGANLISAVSLSHEKLVKIFNAGWSDGKTK